MDHEVNIYNELKAAAEEVASVEENRYSFKTGDIIVIDMSQMSEYAKNLINWTLKQEEEE
jgi:hypothetical protein